MDNVEESELLGKRPSSWHPAGRAVNLPNVVTRNGLSLINSGNDQATISEIVTRPVSHHFNDAEYSDSSRLDAKRYFDLIFASILIVVFVPVISAISIILLLTGGNCIFRHERIGRNGARFSCLKFRTMTVNADHKLEELLDQCPESRKEWAVSQKLKCDPRVTAFGKFLRLTSLDEIPQFFNVLRGDMSLVGPRPIVAAEVEKYRRYFKEYASVRPGISGLWQVSGRNNLTYRRRVALDTFYARNKSLRLDLSILLKTFGAVIRRFGAY